MSKRVIGLTCIVGVFVIGGGLVTALAGARNGSSSEARGTSSPNELTPDEQAAMKALVEAGPNDIRCLGEGAALTCVGVPGDEALAALRRGEVLYGRHVYSDVSRAVDTGIPLFEADELVCEAQATDGTLICHPAGAVQPTLRTGQKMLAAYRRYHVTFRSDGSTVGTHGERTVPLVSANE